MKKHSPYTVIIILFVIGSFTACNSTQQKTTAEKSEPAFVLPTIPAIITNPDERAEYLVTHYWDNYNFKDTTLISHPEITEQEFVNFIDLLPRVPIATAATTMTHLMDVAMHGDSVMLAHFAKMSENYLYDPNSPFRNEEFYIPVLQYLVSSPKVDPNDKAQAIDRLEMAMKNRIGTVATDFTYTLRNGQRAKLSNLSAQYTLLFFNNPDCHDCKRVKMYMDGSPIINKLLKNKQTPKQNRKLAILALYPDADLQIWLKTEYPKEWVNAYDAKRIIEEQQLYDLKAIPTLYLLDKDKQIIMKDAPIEAIEHYLNNIDANDSIR